MARGPKRHLKRLNAPRHWMLDKLSGVWAPRPSTGPHKLRECLPLIILLRNRLKYALNTKEVKYILMQRLIKVDGKARTDKTYPTGFMGAPSPPPPPLLCREKPSFFSAAARLDACWSVRLWRRRSMRAPWPRGGVIRAALAGLSALSHFSFIPPLLLTTAPLLPLFFADVVSIEKSSENFRLLYDVRGRFAIHRIGAEEAKVSIPPPQQQPQQQQQRLARKPPRSSHIIAHTRHFLLTRHLSLFLSISQYKLCRVKALEMGAKKVPYVVTHDGRTIRYPDPLVAVNDTIKIDIETNKIIDFVKFESGNLAMVSGGKNTGRVGVIVSRERHQGSFDIVHIKDSAGHIFATRLGNVFVIGEGSTAMVSLPKRKGLKKTILEERADRPPKGA